MQLRLRRLARLLLAGRALKLQGDPCRVQATRTALRAYAAREAEVSTTVTPEAALHHLRRAPVHLSVHDQDGWPITEYRLERAGGGVNATWSDGHTRFLPDSVFLAQFRLAVFTLRVRGPLPEAPQMAAELARRHDWPHVLAALPD